MTTEMTLSEATVILNAKAHNGYNGWRRGDDDDYVASNNVAFLYPFEAKAVATAYLANEAKPMTRYILTRFTTPISEAYATLDDAIFVCLKEDGRYIVDAKKDGRSIGLYRIETKDGTATITFQP